jgi:hypothetical protein
VEKILEPEAMLTKGMAMEERSAEFYNKGAIPLSPYRPIPKKGSGYANSNSFTFTLLFDVCESGACVGSQVNVGCYRRDRCR